MKPYTISKTGWLRTSDADCSKTYRGYEVLNPSGFVIAETNTWRVARKIADALNAQARWERARVEAAQQFVRDHEFLFRDSRAELAATRNTP